MQASPDSARALIAKGFQALKAGRLADGEAAARAALAADPTRPDGHFLVGLLAVERKEWRTGIAAFGSVTKLNPADRAAWAHLALLQQRVGFFERADDALRHCLEAPPNDAATADLIGTVLAQFGRHREALRWHAFAFQAHPDRADFAINTASSQIFLGDEKSAASTLENFVDGEGAPQAEWLFSTLRRAAGRNRADGLFARSLQTSSASAAAFLAYAAGKEFEDCGLWDDAFKAFDLGARAKRSVTPFDEAAEAALFDTLPAVFTREWFTTRPAGLDNPDPIFIIGQPRTGTTLVERIIASHSAVEPAGELQQFRLAIRRACAERGDHPSDWAQADPRRIGENYIKSVAPMRQRASRFIDKLPRNFLLAPLIAASLPRAKIIHLTRDPLDSCFASFKQLFAEAYPHSYDQQEMARHYARYARLMDHWRVVAPASFLDVSYERLILEFETEVRRIIEYLELPWEDQCLRFNELDAPVATASAVQVREPPHARSVGRSRRYGDLLSPMRRALVAAGLPPPVVGKSER